MIATWMLYCSICALGLYAAAALAERALLVGGGPVRQLWIGAIALSLLIPGAAYRSASRPTTIVSRAPAVGAVPVVPAFDSWSHVSQRVAAAGRPQSPQWNWHAAMTTLSRANQPLAMAWLVLSSALSLYFLVGVIALARLRRRWRRREVLGVPVLISDRAGPAVVGAVAPAIVMPEWALAMAPQQLGLMLRHENEHRRAGDALLMTAAHLTLIAMPWNAALWRLIVRLGMAVELDCDARVLRDADARLYGDLLLEVARPRRGLPLIGATAFAERAGQLERRIRAIARHRNRASRGARAAAAFIGMAALTVAWTAPRPPAPARRSGSHAPQTALPPAAPVIERPSSAPSSAMETAAPASTKRSEQSTVNLTSSVHESPLNVPGAMPPVQFTGTHGASPIVDSVFNRLLTGIVLSPEQVAAIRQVIAALEDRQTAQVTATVRASLMALPALFALQTQRDSALRAILLTDADRAAFDSRISPPGGRGRSDAVLLSPDSLGTGRGRRGGGGGSVGTADPGVFGRGRGGRGGGTTVTTEFAPTLGIAGADEAFARLFPGIVLTPDQEASARTIIASWRREMVALIPEPPMAELQMLGGGVVLMRAESKALLLALLTNDVDRSLLNSRIAIETRVITRSLPATPPHS